MIYLPLDKLLDKRNPEAPKPPVTLPDVTVTPGQGPKDAVDAATDARTRARGNR